MQEAAKDKVAIVTGGSSGIGRATAIKFASQGVSVIVSDVNADGGEETVRIIRSAGGTAHFIRCDVSQSDEVKALVEKTVERFARIDYAFNNAGVLPAELDKTVAETNEEDWIRVININLIGVFLCMKYELIQMAKQGCGAIVNTSSRNGLVGGPFISSYTASKHGVIGLTRSAALEYAPVGIRINAVCPGAVRTTMTEQLMKQMPELEKAYAEMEPMGRMASPDELAESVIWLCSDAASFVTGHAMAVDGGLCAQ